MKNKDGRNDTFINVRLGKGAKNRLYLYYRRGCDCGAKTGAKMEPASDWPADSARELWVVRVEAPVCLLCGKPWRLHALNDI